MGVGFFVCAENRTVGKEKVKKNKETPVDRINKRLAPNNKSSEFDP